MAGEAEDQNNLPAPKVHFSVNIGDQLTLACQKVAGLDSQNQNSKYRVFPLFIGRAA